MRFLAIMGSFGVQKGDDLVNGFSAGNESLDQLRSVRFFLLRFQSLEFLILLLHLLSQSLQLGFSGGDPFSERQ